MIALGLRLTFSGGREAIIRLALIAIAVAVGVGLLLPTLAGLNAVGTQNARYAWLETGYVASNSAGTHDPLLWRLRGDYFDGKLIGRVDLAATGPTAPVPPGIPTLPAAGQFYASPAFAKLLRETPANQLGDRYPGTQIGTIGRAALPSPDSLIIVIGRSVADLSAPGADAKPITAISTTGPDQCGGECAPAVGTNSNGVILILSVVAAALLFPVLVFIGGATRLSAARREQRFAALRLVGATPKQVSVISTVESTVAAAIGTLAGFGVFWLLRPSVARVPFTGERFFAGDLSLNLADVLVVALGVPIAAAVAARLALRRVTISPLGVTRRVAPRPPTAWRIVPLLAGVIELGYFAYVRDIGARSGTNPTAEAAAFLVGVLLVMAGLVIAGPWLTMLASRIVARRARRPASLIAARRLADNPQAGFRAISGLVLAVFVGTCAIGIIGTIVAYDGSSSDVGGAPGRSLVDNFFDPGNPQMTTALPAATTAKLTSIAGVNGIATIRSDPEFVPPVRLGPGKHPLQVGTADLVACADVARVPALGHCPPGAQVVTINPDFGGGFVGSSPMADTTWHAAGVPLAHLQAMRIDTVVIATDGSRAAIEQARTVLDGAFPHAWASQTIGEIHADKSRLLDDYRRLADVVILTSLPIAGCSLAVSIAGGLAERKRPFALLRLTGAPLAMLRRVIGLEAAAPLLITAVVSIGAGLLAAFLFLRAQLYETLQLPGLAFYLVLAAGLLASMAVIASTLPLLNRFTRPETARND